MTGDPRLPDYRPEFQGDPRLRHLEEAKKMADNDSKVITPKVIQFMDAEGAPVGVITAVDFNTWTRVPPAISEKIVQLTGTWTMDMIRDGRLITLAKINQDSKIEYFVGSFNDAVATGWLVDVPAPPQTLEGTHRIGLLGGLTVKTQILRADGTIED